MMDGLSTRRDYAMSMHGIKRILLATASGPSPCRCHDASRCIPDVAVKGIEMMSVLLVLQRAGLCVLLLAGPAWIARASELATGVAPASATRRDRPVLHEWSFPPGVPVLASRPLGGTGNVGNARPVRNAWSLAPGSEGNPPRQIKNGNGGGGGSG